MEIDEPEPLLSKSKGSEVPLAATTVVIYWHQQGCNSLSIRLADKSCSRFIRISVYQVLFIDELWTAVQIARHTTLRGHIIPASPLPNSRTMPMSTLVL